jgi:hypothetical protein
MLEVSLSVVVPPSSHLVPDRPAAPPPLTCSLAPSRSSSSCCCYYGCAKRDRFLAAEHSGDHFLLLPRTRRGLSFPATAKSLDRLAGADVEPMLWPLMAEVPIVQQPRVLPCICPSRTCQLPRRILLCCSTYMCKPRSARPPRCRASTAHASVRMQSFSARTNPATAAPAHGFAILRWHPQPPRRRRRRQRKPPLPPLLPLAIRIPPRNAPSTLL